MQGWLSNVGQTTNFLNCKCTRAAQAKNISQRAFLTLIELFELLCRYCWHWEAFGLQNKDACLPWRAKIEAHIAKEVCCQAKVSDSPGTFGGSASRCEHFALEWCDYEHAKAFRVQGSRASQVHKLRLPLQPYHRARAHRRHSPTKRSLWKRAIRSKHDGSRGPFPHHLQEAMGLTSWLLSHNSENWRFRHLGQARLATGAQHDQKCGESLNFQ